MINIKKNKANSLIILLLNAILIATLAIIFFFYDNGYKQKIYQQNIDEIFNINQASANSSSNFFSSRESKLRDLSLYIEENNMTLQDSIDFISKTNSDNSKCFEIIGPDFKGYHIEQGKSELIPIDYTSGYDDICAMFIKNSLVSNSQIINFAPEFTDAYSAKKSFALYNCIHIKDENGTLIPYTIMLVSTLEDFINLITIESGFEQISTAIIDNTGDYIIGGNAFKSNNFFNFLTVFNNLTLDQANEIKENIKKTQKGSISYKDARNHESAFVYTLIPNKEWYCITLVPKECFHTGNTDFSFSVIVIIIMLLLLIIDLLYLISLNRKLKISAENERIASVAKSDFLSRMSHDMRTPMNGIIGMTHLTKDIDNLPQEAQENLSAILDSSTYLLQLINDILDMNKIESKKFTLTPETVDANEVIGYIVATAKTLGNQKNINIEYDNFKATFDFIKTDRMRLQQIFINILSNAIKFTPPKGTIRIALKCIKIENGIAYDEISVEDTGCGMSEEFLNHIFEPFSQERSKIIQGQEGTGLGMAIVKNLVELMGGTIDIKSKVGVGTKITIWINFECVFNVQPKTTVSNQNDLEKLIGKKVLLVEDHPLNAEIASRLLSKKNMVVCHAENGEIGVSMFSKSSINEYDCILMDIRMPVMDGLEATRQIRALEREDAKSIPIIAMTANAYPEDIKTAIDSGMNAHLSKPIKPEILYTELEKYL